MTNGLQGFGASGLQGFAWTCMYRPCESYNVADVLILHMYRQAMIHRLPTALLACDYTRSLTTQEAIYE